MKCSMASGTERVGTDMTGTGLVGTDLTGTEMIGTDQTGTDKTLHRDIGTEKTAPKRRHRNDIHPGGSRRVITIAVDPLPAGCDE